MLMVIIITNYLSNFKQAQLKQRQGRLDEAKDKLKEVEDVVEGLTSKCEAGAEKKRALATEVADCEAKLARAIKLIHGIGGKESFQLKFKMFLGDQERWENQVLELSKKYQTLVGDVLLTTGYITYLGPLPPSYRTTLLNHWKSYLSSLKIGYSSDFNFAEALSDPLQNRIYNMMGLIDAHSVENAILVKESNKYPLMIDPQKQAHRWIQNMEKGNNIIINLIIIFFRTKNDSACL